MIAIELRKFIAATLTSNPYTINIFFLFRKRSESEEKNL